MTTLHELQMGTEIGGCRVELPLGSRAKPRGFYLLECFCQDTKRSPGNGRNPDLRLAREFVLVDLGDVAFGQEDWEDQRRKPLRERR